MRIVTSIGGNALLRGGAAAEASASQREVEAAAESLARIAAEHELAITHMSGPRVTGMLDLALRNALADRDVITVLSHVAVSADDPDIDRSSGSLPSLEPHAIVELRTLRTLMGAGVLVICAGAGGVPITVDPAGTMQGVEAVIDEDLTAALLARRLDADLFLLLTDVDALHLGRGFDHEGILDRASPTELREYDFEPRTMGPKVEAACRFVEATGRRAAIGSLTNAGQIMRGADGTQIALSRA